MAINQHKLHLLTRYWYHSRLSVALESIVIGIAAGLVIVLFRFFLSKADTLRRGLYEALSHLPWYWTLIWIAVLVLTGLFLGWAAKMRPMIKGSGIPQVKGALLRLMPLQWLPDLPLKFVTGVLGLGAGLSLGREGPSIQIGAYIGQGVLSVFRRSHREQKYLVAAASAAGVAAAFNAPLAGVLFVLEELQPSFTPIFLACTMGASMAADAVAGYFFGQGPVFDFRHIEVLPLEHLPSIILLGIICALLGDLFKRSLYGSLNLYDRLRIPQTIRPIIPLLASVPLGLFLFDVTGGGHTLIESLSADLPAAEWSLGLIGLLLAGKILFTALCYGSGTSGGIFLPLLACGALTGCGLGKLLVMTGLAVESQSLNYVILGMAAFFTGAVKAPVTAVVLILEMSGNFNHLGGLVLVSFSSFIASELIGSRPVYAVLLERLLRSGGKQESPIPRVQAR
ncbi:MAG: ClC family H(+)/Cl(-) exchange transporter [Treponema sp.]|jgi:H+/Cl- antiporter ClcA|nr:ClC family H(+)/Cl(-) exchange transporter [Treponema sp.]